MRSADRVHTAHALANAGQANQNLQQEAGVRRGPESQALGHLVQGRCIIKSSTTNALFLRKSMQKKIELPEENQSCLLFTGFLSKRHLDFLIAREAWKPTG